MIKTYRKKPVEIEAVRLMPNSIREVYEFIYGPIELKTHIDHDKWMDYESIVETEGLRLKTLESDGETQIASMGDFVIKGVEGEFYPCKPEIFAKTYQQKQGDFYLKVIL